MNVYVKCFAIIVVQENIWILFVTLSYLFVNPDKLQAIHCVKSVRIRIIFWSVYNPNTGKCRQEKLRIRTLFRQWLYSISIKQMTLILNLLLVQRKSKMHHQLTYWASICILIKFVWYLEINTIHLLGAIHAFFRVWGKKNLSK